MKASKQPPTPDNMQIPRILFQTSPQPAPDYLRQIICDKAPGWNYCHFTDADIFAFFAQYPSAEFPKLREVFNSFTRGEHKADLFRYYFLYLRGGLFLDSDVLPAILIDEIVGAHSTVLVRCFDSVNGIFNGILGCYPGSPLIHDALRHCYHTAPALIENSYHHFCKTLDTLVCIHQPPNSICYEEVNMTQTGLGGSIVIDKSGRRIFTHYWQLGYVPSPDAAPPTVGTRVVARSRHAIQNIVEKLYLNPARRLWQRVPKSYQRRIRFDYSQEFQDVYQHDLWGGGSGLGSSVNTTKDYNRFLTEFLRNTGVTQVTDLGCGDWQSSHFMYDQLGPIDYLGIDCVPTVISENRKQYPSYCFQQKDVVANPGSVRDSEVYILKDVLQHLRTADIYRLLDHLTSKSYRYIIIANYAEQEHDDQDLPDMRNVARSRGLCAKYTPLKRYGAIPLRTYHGGETKEISLIHRRTHWNHFRPGETWAFNLQTLRVVETGNPLQRVGPDSDGGYVIYPGLKYDRLISCGVADDIRFEEAFLTNHPGLQGLAFDGTINSFPPTNLPLEWVRKNIAAFPRPDESDLTEILDGVSNAFLKMDIEGSEFDWITAASPETLRKFSQIVLEVHWPFDLYRAKALAKIATTHVPIHIHGNNYNDAIIPKGLPSGRSKDGTILMSRPEGEKIRFPEVFEVTYLRRDLAPKNSFEVRKQFPTDLDQPNCPRIPDLGFMI